MHLNKCHIDVFPLFRTISVVDWYLVRSYLHQTEIYIILIKIIVNICKHNHGASHVMLHYINLPKKLLEREFCVHNLKGRFINYLFSDPKVETSK